MLNNYFKIILLLLIISCGSCKSITQQSINEYKVVAIDSTQNFYIIDLEKRSEKSRVIEKKVELYSLCADKLKIGQRYNIDLQPYSKSGLLSTLEPYMYSIEGIVVWNSKESYNLYESKSIKNLCIVRDESTH